MNGIAPGQLVICVNDSLEYIERPPVPCTRDLDGLRRGKIYTVRGVNRYLGIDCLLLEEIRRGVFPDWGGEAGYHPLRFRPVDDRALDAFRAMLEPTRRREHV